MMDLGSDLVRSIALSVEVITAVSETLAEDATRSVQGVEACREARSLASRLEKLSLPLEAESVLRSLLSSVTRVLLLTDELVVRQIRPDNPGSELSGVKTMQLYCQFVKAFSDFASDALRLARILDSSGARAAEREERRGAHLRAARQLLERSSLLLRSSSKLLLACPSNSFARENRDAVFCQMRRAIDLMHFVLFERLGSLRRRPRMSLRASSSSEEEEEEASSSSSSSDDILPMMSDPFDGQPPLFASLASFEASVSLLRLQTPVSDAYKARLTRALRRMLQETLHDFTDSAYVSHEHRQNLLLHADRAAVELAHLLRTANPDDVAKTSGARGVEAAVRTLLKSSGELRLELHATALELTRPLIDSCTQAAAILDAIKASAMEDMQLDDLDFHVERLRELVCYIEDVARLMRHVLIGGANLAFARHAVLNVAHFGPQVGLAGHALRRVAVDQDEDHRHSKACLQLAVENLDAFSRLWAALMTDVSDVARLLQMQPRPQPPGVLKMVAPEDESRSKESSLPTFVISQAEENVEEDEDNTEAENEGNTNATNFLDVPQAYRSSNSMSNPIDLSRSASCVGLQQVGTRGDYMHSSPSRSAPFLVRRHSDVAAYYSGSEQRETRQTEFEDNEIVRRARIMEGMATDLLGFTRQHSHPRVRTTQDFFTLADKLAEDTNLLYKTVRLFSYSMPSGEDKRGLVALADGLPKHCHHLRTLIQTSTVGKAATFTKVDHVVRQSSRLVSLVGQVVRACIDNASKYGLDLSQLSLEEGAGMHSGSHHDLSFGGSASSSSMASAASAGGGGGS